MNRFCVLSAVLFGFAFQAQAGANLEKLVEQLKDRPANYEVVGTVCEEVAKLEMEKAPRNLFFALSIALL